MIRKNQWKCQEISENEYMDWKLNWPSTCTGIDHNGKEKMKPNYEWRKYKED